MRAITLGEDGPRFQTSHPEPTADTGETRVKVIQAGICETDLQLARGYMNFCGVLGHEFVGIAETGQWAGQRVVGEINCNCQRCPTCASGRPTHCPNRTVVGIDRHDGAFAQWVTIPDHNLHPVPDALTNDQAVLTEPLAAAFQILQQVTVAATDRVAILGDGRLGLLSAQVIAGVTKHLTVFGKHGPKLLRFGHLGIETVQLPSAGVDEHEVPIDAFDVVVDCTGSASGLNMALTMVRPRGTVVMKTTVADTHSLSLAPLVVDEINLVGSRCGPFDKAIDAMAGGQVNVDDLITDRFTLDQVEQAFEAARNPNSFKVVFDIG